MGTLVGNVCLKGARNLGFVPYIFPATSHSVTKRFVHQHKENDLKTTHANPNRPLCRTSQLNPANHEKQHEGLFYKVDEESSSKYFTNGQRPHLNNMFKAFNESCIMVRDPALEIINCLKMANYNFPVIRFLLYGPHGAGKTVSMSHVLHFCGLSDWLIVHLPWAPWFIKNVKETSQSTSRPGRIDTPVPCLRWLKDFKKLNNNFLTNNNPTLIGNYRWTKRDQSEAGSSWQELISYAVERPKFATDVMNVLLKEIKQQTNQNKFKTLVAVDGINCFFDETDVRREEDRRYFYEPNEMSVIYNIKKLLSNDWKNGAVLCSVDKMATKSQPHLSDLPLYLLGKEGFELFDPFTPVHVGQYSDKEVYSALEYYTDRKWIQNPAGLTDEGKKEITFLSCKNPLELYRVTRAW